MNPGKTLFAQFMEFVPWTSFSRIVHRYRGDVGVRRLSCTEQLRVMAFAQLTWSESLRDIEATLSANATKLYAMGFRGAIKRSTLEEQDDNRVRLSQSFDAETAEVMEAARQMALEGIMLKGLDYPYTSGRTDSWLKLKCTMTQEFVICGFTSRTGSKQEVGGLLLAYHQDGVLRYAGSVGTGWDAKTGAGLHADLSKLEVGQPPLDPRTVTPGRWSRRAPGSEKWVKPTLVAKEAFSEWTPEGQMRHSGLKGLRRDLLPQSVVRESPASKAS